MAQIQEDGYGGVRFLMTSGLEVHLPGLNPAGRDPNIQDIKNLATALLGIAQDLDDRLAKLEKK
jgi:hypothetical protein